MPDNNSGNQNQSSGSPSSFVVQEVPTVTSPNTSTTTQQGQPDPASFSPSPPPGDADGQDNQFGINTGPNENAAPLYTKPTAYTGRRFSGRAVAMIMGLLVLVGAVAAGVVLVQQQQNINEKAAGTAAERCIDNPSVSGSIKLTGAEGCPTSLSGSKFAGPAPNPSASDGGCLGYSQNRSGWTLTTSSYKPSPSCGQCEQVDVTYLGQDFGVYAYGGPCSGGSNPPPSAPPPPSSGGNCDVTAMTMVPDNPLNVGDTAVITVKVKVKQGDVNRTFATEGDKSIATASLGGKFNKSAGTQTINVTAVAPGTASVTYKMETIYFGKTSTCTKSLNVVVNDNTPPPPPPTASGQCQAVAVYDTSWNKLTSTQMSALKAGDTIRVAVKGAVTNGGNISKARFTFNGSLRSPITQQRAETGEYYEDIVIPQGATSVTLKGEVYNDSLGWF